MTNSGFAMVDDSEFERLSQFKWYGAIRHGVRYAMRYERISEYRGRQRKKVLMHHAVLGQNTRTDHIDGNGMNNQKRNLRHCTQAQNAMNRKATNGRLLPKGVYWSNTYNCFMASIACSKKTYHLGRFKDPESAEAAYNDTAKRLFKEFYRNPNS